MSAQFIFPGRRLQLLQTHDPFKQWWSLDETRFCRECDHLIVGADIVIAYDEREVPHFQCPTHQCGGGFADWEYPNLHL